jgi:hypothetical protein
MHVPIIGRAIGGKGDQFGVPEMPAGIGDNAYRKTDSSSRMLELVFS